MSSVLFHACRIRDINDSSNMCWIISMIEKRVRSFVNVCLCINVSMYVSVSVNVCVCIFRSFSLAIRPSLVK